MEENPAEEIEEMSLFYQLQGFSPEESQRMAERLAEQPEQMVQAMAQSELGLSQHHFPNQWTSAFSAALSTAIGAFIPIIPFFFPERIPGGDRSLCHQHRGAFRGWRGEVAHHHPLVVGLWAGNDGRGRDRSGGHIWPRTGLRRAWLGIRQCMTPPQLAVVVPAFNEAQRLTENLLTLLGYLQSYRPEAELIVVDDGSTDGTAQVAEELFARRPDVMARASCASP